MKFTLLATFAALTQAITLGSNSPAEVGMGLVVNSFGQNPSGDCNPGDDAQVWYTGKLQNGKVFDTNIKGEFSQAFKFVIGAQQVIGCWDTGLAQMRPGEKATLTCPPNTAYGEVGAGDSIPPNSTLTFDVEVINCATRN